MKKVLLFVSTLIVMDAQNALASDSHFSIFRVSPAQSYDAKSNSVETYTGIHRGTDTASYNNDDELEVSSSSKTIAAATTARVSSQMVIGLVGAQSESETSLQFHSDTVDDDEPFEWDSRVTTVSPILTVHVRKQAAFGVSWTYLHAKSEEDRMTDRKLQFGGIFYSKEGSVGIAYTPRHEFEFDETSSWAPPEWLIHGNVNMGSGTSGKASVTRIQYAAIGDQDRTTADEHDVYVYQAGLAKEFSGDFKIGVQGTHRTSSYDSREDISMSNIATNSIAFQADMSVNGNVQLGFQLSVLRGRETGKSESDDYVVSNEQIQSGITANIGF